MFKMMDRIIPYPGINNFFLVFQRLVRQLVFNYDTCRVGRGPFSLQNRNAMAKHAGQRRIWLLAGSCCNGTSMRQETG